MVNSNHTRRRFVGVLAVGAIGLSGCTDDDTGTNGTDPDGTEPQETEPEETEPEETEPGETDDDENGTDDDENGTDDDENGTDDWEDVSDILLEGYSDRWVGVEPAVINGDNNPTLVLTEGEAYTITWINGDGAPHDLQIWDDDDNVVNDLISDESSSEGDEVSLDFTATSEMAQYACSYHHATGQLGDIDVV